MLRGAGGNFCSGGDVHEIIGPLTKMDERGPARFTRMTGDLVRAMRACPQPIIAAVEGVCAGAGAILAMASDIRFGQPGARTAFLFSRVGLSRRRHGRLRDPAADDRPRPRRRAAVHRPRHDAATRASPGASTIASSRMCMAEAYALADELATGPTIAHCITKRQLDAEWNVSLDEALEMEARAQARCMETNDFKRAYDAFANKQKPVFQGD